MEVGKMLTYLMFILIPIVAMLVYISISSKLFPECREKITGSKFSILGYLSKCVEYCWSKHDFGGDVYSDDCFLIEVNPTDKIEKNEIEKFLGRNVKVYFNTLEANSIQKLKIRYNSTGKEISLILVEIQ
ncbi:MAG: hypothetical protein QXG39_07885 [Candidatus Aenigmatarchaeota archaeon]